MHTIDHPGEQARVVALLVEQHGIAQVCADACREARIRGCEQQVAYCLAVLCFKRHARGSGSARPDDDELDPAAAGFGDHLRLWARAVADNVRAWGSAYTAIQDETDEWRTETLDRLMPRTGPDDVLTASADKVVRIISDGPRLADMSLEAVRRDPPTANQYAFQGALDAWIARIASNDTARLMGTVDPSDRRIIEPPAREDAAGPLRDEVYRLLIAGVADIARTEGMLADAIRSADAMQARGDDVRLGNAEDRASFERVRAQLAHVVDELRVERRDFGLMLAYLALALGGRTRIRRRVALLSLRGEALAAAVRDDIARRLRDIVGDDAQPLPILVLKTERAIDAHPGFPRVRLTELNRLRGGGARRAERLEALRDLLDELPPSIADLAAIAAAIDSEMTTTNVSTVRHSLAEELRSVDRSFERSFRRYARSIA